MKEKHALWRDEGAAAAVEFAILLPFLVLLFAGFSEFGLILRQQQILEKGARDAGRFLSHYTDLTASPGTICSSNNPLTVKAAAENLVLYADLCGSGTPVISNLTGTDITITSPTYPLTVTLPDGTTADVTVDTYQVDVSIAYSDVMGLFSLLPFSTPTLTTSHVEREIGE